MSIFVHDFVRINAGGGPYDSPAERYGEHQLLGSELPPEVRGCGVRAFMLPAPRAWCAYMLDVPADRGLWCARAATVKTRDARQVHPMKGSPDFDRLSPNGQGVLLPFTLSLSKGGVGFDKLSPNVG